MTGCCCFCCCYNAADDEKHKFANASTCGYNTNYRVCVCIESTQTYTYPVAQPIMIVSSSHFHALYKSYGIYHINVHLYGLYAHITSIRLCVCVHYYFV